MTLRNKIAIGIILASLALLVPGLIQPMLNIQVAATFPIVGKMELFNQTQSIMQSVESLFNSKNYLVAILIFLFSVLVPVAKALALLVVLCFKNFEYRRHVYGVIALIGKWSMADVFVVGVFMAYLAANANQNIQASLFEGFYFFAAYCVVSIIGIQMVQVDESVST